MGESTEKREHDKRHLRKCFEECAAQRERGIDDGLAERLSQGRGPWILLLWPCGFAIFLFTSYVTVKALAQLPGIPAPISWLGLVAGAIYTLAWYRWNFTRRHPFISSVIGHLFTSITSLMVINALGL